jgi:hypothetical protein
VMLYNVEEIQNVEDGRSFTSVLSIFPLSHK